MVSMLRKSAQEKVHDGVFTDVRDSSSGNTMPEVKRRKREVSEVLVMVGMTVEVRANWGKSLSGALPNK